MSGSNQNTSTVEENDEEIEDQNAEASPEQVETQMNQLFLPHRVFCAHKGINLKEVILEDFDVSKAIIDYITANQIQQIVVGASNRKTTTRKYKITDVPTALIKGAPDYCSVYVIHNGKPITFKATRSTAPFRLPALTKSKASENLRRESEKYVRNQLAKRHWRRLIRDTRRTSLRPDPSSNIVVERFTDPPRASTSERSSLQDNSFLDIDNDYLSVHQTMSPSSFYHGSFTEDSDFDASTDFQIMEFCDAFELSSGITESPTNALMCLAANGEAEIEIRRLRLELKQTMEMYNTACKEAINAKKKASELHRWKVEKASKMDKLRQTAKEALALVKIEKAKCKALMEKVDATQKEAELEAQKRLDAEAKAKHEEERQKNTTDSSTHVHYRKYSIDEIEVATNYFAKDMKIGEGAYGPVYKACLDHTPVAVKVRRPDAADGRKQFQKEVEILSCIRHPNLVILLGACSEYGCLVYEYMDHGSLEDRLLRRGNSPPIPWRIRFKIAAEIATALLFLHKAQPEPLVHRDLKPANILLDHNYVSKISDVGLAALLPPSASKSTQCRMTSAAGTFYYIDPEYQRTSMLNTKSDLYSLGIMFLQIITAKSPVGLPHYVEQAIEKGKFATMLDPTITDCPIEVALAFAKLSLKCTELKRKDRPDLGQVILPELDRLRNLGQESIKVSQQHSGKVRGNVILPELTRTKNIGQESFKESQHSGNVQDTEVTITKDQEEQRSDTEISAPWTYLSDTNKSDLE